MNKIVNGVANDFEFDINDYNMFPPNVEKVIITKENYNRLFKGLEEENMFLKDKVEQLQDKIDKAISMLELSGGREKISKDFVNIGRKRYDEILKILKGEQNEIKTR